MAGEYLSKPLFGVPGPGSCVENPDGVYKADGMHSLYDGPLNYPLIPGDYDFTKNVLPDFRDADDSPPPGLQPR